MKNILKINCEKIPLSHNLNIHPALEEKINIYSHGHMLPNNFEELLPDLNELLNSGLVNEKLIPYFSASSQLNDMIFFLFNLREDYFKNYGFSLLSTPLVEELSLQLSKKNVIEIGAGTGFLSKQLIENGVIVTAIDSHIKGQSDYGFALYHTPILHIDGIEYLKTYENIADCIILSWSNYDNDFAASILDNMQSGQRLYYMGEREGGCTANDRFFHLLEQKAEKNYSLTEKLQKHSLSWSCIHDDWYVFDIL